MNYLISKSPCTLISNEVILIKPNVLYEISQISPCLVIGEGDTLPFVFDGNENASVYKIYHASNTYYFLFPHYAPSSSTIKIRFQNRDFLITVSNKLTISFDGEILLEANVNNITYSHLENFGKFCIIYFQGKRNYLVVLAGKELSFADFYDECNIEKGEYFFMSKLYDCLNHGRVLHLTQMTEENYLVYLDNEELHLKTEFVGNVFLDCLLAKNYKYCNHLLADDIKQKDAKNVVEFFPDFDEFFPIKENEFFLFKQNTLAGIYKFDVKDCVITNVMCL